MNETMQRICIGNLAVIALLLTVSGCGQVTPASPITQETAMATPAASPLRPIASVQEIMEALVDPSADAVWDAVGTSITENGVEDHQPRTDEEWKQTRLHAIALVEATNLLMMDGRRLVPEGGRIADDGAQGVLSTEDAEKQYARDRQVFVQFAVALHQMASKMLNAIDTRDTNAMLKLGEQMDEVCESCHVKFWYPTQLLPRAPTLGNK